MVCPTIMNSTIKLALIAVGGLAIGMFIDGYMTGKNG
jgi:hypothetical protein